MGAERMSDAAIEQFLAVCEHGHFGRAAEALGISQQAVSKGISALEKRIGTRLFNRGAFGAVPTSAGEVLAARARQSRAELALGFAEIDSMRGSRGGRVRVGVGLCFAGRLMPLTIERYRALHPKVHVSAIVESSGALFPMLLAGELDFCASAPPPDFPIAPELARETLFVDADSVIVRRNHPLAIKTQVRLADLAGFPWIMSAQIGGTWDRVCGEFTAAGLAPPTQLVRTDSIALARELLQHGPYIVLLSRENVSRDLVAGSMVALSVEGIPERRPAILTYRRRSSMTPAAANMIRVLKQVCSDLHGPPP